MTTGVKPDCVVASSAQVVYKVAAVPVNPIDAMKGIIAAVTKNPQPHRTCCKENGHGPDVPDRTKNIGNPS
jgi:hypothetical protein